MNDKHSRLNKFEKRRKNTKAISIFIVIGSILLVLLIGLLVFGDNDNDTDQAEEKKSELVIEESGQEETEKDNDDTEDEASEEDTKEEDDETIEKESVESSDDNVTEAYTANWKPIGTKQEGEHTTQFEKETQDWKEMEQAASLAAEIDESDMMTWRIENGGDPQKTIATVSDNEETEVYRVYLSWIDEEGWQPTKVEILKENDKK